MNKEELMLQKRLAELSGIAYRRGIAVFSDFLNLNELHILHSAPKGTLSSAYETFGGYEYAERQMVAFLPDALYYDLRYPIRVLSVRPADRRYAEELGHRDYLGAILNLGIERCKIGDFVIRDGECLVFCHEKMADYICLQLTRVRHTAVITAVSDPEEIAYVPELTEVTGTVASVRLDAVLSIGFPMSRSRLVPLIEGGKVFVNGKMITSNGYRLKENDIISVRGMGRIQFGGILSETRKGRYLVRVSKY